MQTGLVTKCTLDRWLDGDTAEVEITRKVRVRLLDCWAPEIHGVEKSFGVKSKEFLETAYPKGTFLYLRIPTDGSGELSDLFTFGRVLGKLYDQDGNIIAEQLQERNLAFATKEELREFLAKNSHNDKPVSADGE